MTGLKDVSSQVEKKLSGPEVIIMLELLSQLTNQVRDALQWKWFFCYQIGFPGPEWATLPGTQARLGLALFRASTEWQAPIHSAIHYPTIRPPKASMIA